MVGTAAYDRIFEAVKESLEGRREPVMESLDYLPKHLTRRLGSQNREVILLISKLQKDVTSDVLTALSIPSRQLPQCSDGRTSGRSVHAGRAGNEKELIVIAQETTVYGGISMERRDCRSCWKKLCEIKGIQWIRVMYCYPEEITDELLEVMAREPKICHYLDLPIQHCNNEILKKMGRKTNKKDLLATLEKIRRYMPDVFLRTSLISGFPGETKQMHDECVEFVKEVQFDRLGVFPYSAEEGTPAASYDGQVPEETKACLCR